MRARPEIGQRVKWRADGQRREGHVVTCAGPDRSGTYDLMVERRRPAELYRLRVCRRAYFHVNREVHRYEMRLHTLQPRH